MHDHRNPSVAVPAGDLEILAVLASWYVQLVGAQRPDRIDTLLGGDLAMAMSYCNIAADARGCELPHEQDAILDALAGDLRGDESIAR